MSGDEKHPAGRGEEPVASNPFRTTPPWQRESGGWKGAVVGIAVLVLALGGIAGVAYLAMSGSDEGGADDALPASGTCGAVDADDEEPLAERPDFAIPPERSTAVIETDYGSVEILLFGNVSPCGVAGFSALAGQGYYDGHDCHRVQISPQQPTTVVDCGEPGRGFTDDALDEWTGSGGPKGHGPGWRYQAEVDGAGKLMGDVLALPLDDEGRAGSAFTLVRGDSVPSGNLSVIGQVVDGYQVLDAIAASVPTETYEGMPPQAITIRGVEIRAMSEDGFPSTEPSGEAESADPSPENGTSDEPSESEGTRPEETGSEGLPSVSGWGPTDR
ncbi:peptidylprolyl isomerase [Salininema proteolyticum]|uniref:Peptidylprolyl isomerase n=1 Tax=Salininema proteolyticum TaxID=1607685 RepID=A0ABV8TSX6_9ACTN